MGKIRFEKIVSVLVIFVMLLSSFAGCSKKSESANSKVTAAPSTTSSTDTASGETKVLRFGTHYVAGLDPNYKDPTTGEYTMGEAERQASLAALDAVKKQLNVEIEFVQYATDTRSELLTSVLANNPVCDIAILWGGSEQTILAQNILQPLDEYADLFSDEEYSWMFYDKLYGHNYLLTSNQYFASRWPLIYNATMIEKVDTLKDDSGKTIYPTDLFQEGKWTWSTFKDYLSKIQAYYKNTAAPEACVQDKVQAYETDYRFASVDAVFACGGTLYDDNGIQVNSEKALKGAAYIKELRDAGVLTDPGVYDDGYTPQWCQGASEFGLGGTIFTDCPGWLVNSSATACTDRGESVGMVPWPRADELSADDPGYQQVLTAGDSIGILKGVDADTTKLCLEFLKLYYNIYYKTLGGVDSVLDYKESAVADQATSYGLDIFNETYGDALLNTFTYIANHAVTNDYSDLLGYRVIWDEVLGKSLFGVDGSASFNVAVKANLSRFQEKEATMESILSSDEIRDNMPPDITVEGTLAFPKGTNPAKINFSDYVTITDAVDGTLDQTAADYDYSSVDFNKVGTYENGLTIKRSDKSKNEGSKSANVLIYNPKNKKAPVIKAKEEYRTIKVDEDASIINWKDDFIESAKDQDGLDVKGNITADISSLDTSTTGDYKVVITVTDYAGNSSKLNLKVTVAEEAQ